MPAHDFYSEQYTVTKYKHKHVCSVNTRLYKLLVPFPSLAISKKVFVFLFVVSTGHLRRSICLSCPLQVFLNQWPTTRQVHERKCQNGAPYKTHTASRTTDNLRSNPFFSTRNTQQKVEADDKF